MSGEPLHLKANAVVQPLVDRWYAWSHLIPPATLALNHVDRHLRIMDSYTSAPWVHADAVADPAMAGGPFIDLGGERADDVAALADGIRHRRAALLDFGLALRELTSLLDGATGYSLEPLYADVPTPLRGYVELSYDLLHRAGFRLLEPLLYASPHHDRSAQSLVLFEVQGDDRPFVLSTPSLDAPDRLHLDVPFDSPAVDALARLKWEPRPLGEIADELGLDDEAAATMAGLLTEDAPPPRPAYDGQAMRWRYFGHACVLVEAGGVAVLTDPLVAYAHGGPVARYTFHDLPDVIDCVLITHGHQDHTMLETLLQLRHRVRAVAVPRSGGGSLQDPSLKLILEHAGFSNVVEVQELDVIDLGPLVVRAMPFVGEHADLDIRAKTTYLVEGGGKRLFFGADTCNVEPLFYEHAREVAGDVDTVFLGMECDGAPLHWLYGPLVMAPRTAESRRMEQSRRLNGSDCARAADLVRALRGQQAFVYSMGQEPWLKYLLSLDYRSDSIPIVESDKLIEWCRSTGIEADRLFGRKEVVVDG
jgi:L-ascorbate metabolism protein UlaG (beta-lactamase superfamily)